MRINFTAVYKIDGKTHTQPMQYDSKDIEKTLVRRLTTAFPNATDVELTLDYAEETGSPKGPSTGKKP